MSISTAQYAELSFRVYDDWTAGVRPHNHEEEVTYNGVTYKILEHANNPKTGYQGTIYQRVDTDEIVVAHRRGTPSAPSPSLLWRRVAISALLASCLSLPACHMTNSITKNGAMPSDIPLSVFSGDGPVYGHRKPQPQHVYELTIKIEDAPGPFQYATASVSVQGKNPACGVPHGFPAGTINAPHAVVPFELQRVSATEFRGIFAADPLMDEVYWEGRPACEWEFVAASFGLGANGKEGETGFGGSVYMEDLVSGQPVRRYYWKGGYPDDGKSNFSDGGFDSPEKFYPELRNNLFIITAVAKKL